MSFDPNRPFVVESSPRVVLAKKASTNSFGIASLILGCISLLICWIPFVGFLAILISLVGFVFGIIGLFAAAFRRGAGLAYAIAGCFLCSLLAILPLMCVSAIVAIPAFQQIALHARERIETCAYF